MIAPRARTTRTGSLLLLAVPLAIGILTSFALASTPLVPVPGGSYLPFYPVEGEGAIEVSAYEIQAHAVTNADFLAFVLANPEWDRGVPPAVFADPGYLVHWAGPAELGAALADAPVTNVSWFAAGAYCTSIGLRLPTEAEWEFVARADATHRNASGDPLRSARLLAAYSLRGDTPEPVGSAPANVYGASDLHEGVWEWVEDPWSLIAMNDSRNAGDRDVARVCGGASLGARDRSDYPAFLRHATRAGLGPSSLGASLGFRCAD